MYGAVADVSAAERTDPLLPPREPSTAESRRARGKRLSRRLVPAGISRRQLMALQQNEQQQEVKPVMKNLRLFQRSGTKSKIKQKQKRRATLAAASMEIETPVGAVASATTPLKKATLSRGKSDSAVPLNAGEDDGIINHNQTDPARKKHSHTWLYVLLHASSTHPHAIWYKKFISTIILLDVAFFAASTEEKWNLAFPELFYWEEGLVSTIFMIEYLCRIAVAPESHRYAGLSPLKARLRYVCTWTALMDAASALPFFLEIPTGVSLPNLTWIRLFRLVRILRTESYARSIDTVWRVIYYNGEILYVALNICIMLVLVTAVLMYYLRPRDPVDAEDFSSLMATMYLSALMLTGQGQPEGDLPWYTKAVVLLTGFFSVAMFAIPASMLTWGFEAEAERCARKTRQKYVAVLQQEANDNANQEDDNRSYSQYVSSSSSSEGDTTDEEYLEIIAGGDGDADADDKSASQDQVIKQLIQTFQTSDTDASGSLSMDEFVELMTDPTVVSQHLTMVGMATSVGLLAKRVHRLESELAESHRKLDEILRHVQQR